VRLPLLGEVEWRGSPAANGVALVEIQAATPLEHYQRQRQKTVSPGTVLGVLVNFVESMERLLAGAGAARHGKERFFGAAAKLLNPRSVGMARDGTRLVFTPQLDMRPPVPTPPDWAFFAAPEAVAGGTCGEPALVFGVARLALALLLDPNHPDAKAAEVVPYGWQRLALPDIAFHEFKRDPRAAGLPKELRALLAKCLRARPTGRVATLAKLRAALKNLQRAEQMEAPPATPPQVHALALRVPAPEGMAVVDAGQYISGEKKLPRTLRAFAIDLWPVTEKDYRQFLKETGREPVDGGPGTRASKYDRHPVVNVTWREAEEYAEYYGKRLPTIYEWEKAARGKDGRKFPYGPEYSANTGRLRVNGTARGKENVKESAPVGAFPLGASPYGVLDMAGNVLEWTSTARRQGERIFRAAKGACFLDGSVELSRCTSIQFKKPDTRESHVGFRCVKDLD
jgi:formylglycine-generating enzyme required for sulfatase activity